ncbi:uncharacterized protein LOC130625144 [Hydractinia symbiolongicarpus]|uniref:uncharacterized protein LOC130625144 n=1 Tax=Hydractinia symbiolongicarpus TaxID=13093 RepID=UPI00254D61B3|nr:uncharacterized protein LOC130625144 [Hydractinia symbiolongicarpus]
MAKKPISENWTRESSMPSSYNPNKPAKYGLLYKSLNDARILFTYQILPYCGKPDEGDGPYYLSATDYVKNEVKDPKSRGEFQSTIHWEKEKGDIALCTYTIEGKSKGKKNVLVLSTMRPIMGITRDDEKHKPSIIKFYDFTKGGTDIIDQKISKHSCKSVTNK